MVGVVASWYGSCQDQNVQKELCESVAQLADISCQLYKDHFHQEMEPLYYDGEKVEQKILIYKGYFYEQVVPEVLEKWDDDYFIAHSMRFYGIIFPLFDPRRYNSLNMMAHEYNFGFVFIRCDDPAFDGRLVHIKPLKPESTLYNTGKYLIKKPQLDLRYYLEGWTRNLLAWVKHFYIPDLSYWIWSENPGGWDYEDVDPHDHKIRDEKFKALMDWFLEEAEDWASHLADDQGGDS